MGVPRAFELRRPFRPLHGPGRFSSMSDRKGSACSPWKMFRVKPNEIHLDLSRETWGVSNPSKKVTETDRKMLNVEC